MEHFGEVLTAMVTPFNDNLEVDYDRVRELSSYLVNNGSDGLVVLGTTGEVPTLTKSEKIKILKTVKDEVGDKAHIVAGTGSYSTFASIDLTKEAEAIGVDGIMLVGPYYNKPPQEGLYNHYSMIAEETSLPVMIYNVPSRTSRNIEPDTVSRLSEISNIIAVKEASGDLGQVAEISRKTGDDFYIYSGDDKFTLPILSVGGQGVVSVAAHLVGPDIKKMIKAYKSGDIEMAQQLNKKLGPLFEGIFITTNPIPIKSALNMKGLKAGLVRPPLINLDKNKKKKLKEILNNMNIIE